MADVVLCLLIEKASLRFFRCFVVFDSVVEVQWEILCTTVDLHFGRAIQHKRQLPITSSTLFDHDDQIVSSCVGKYARHLINAVIEVPIKIHPRFSKGTIHRDHESRLFYTSLVTSPQVLLYLARPTDTLRSKVYKGIDVWPFRFRPLPDESLVPGNFLVV